MGHRSDKIEDKWSELSGKSKSGFMAPCLDYGPYVIVENKHGEGRLLPANCADLRGDDEHIIERRTGYYARLSASGYMDCTDYETIDSVADVVSFFDTWTESADDETEPQPDETETETETQI